LRQNLPHQCQWNCKLILVLMMTFYMSSSPSLSAPNFEMTAKDQAAYRQAFSDIAAGKTYRDLSNIELSDPLLVSYIEFHRLFAPQTQSSYSELTQWLNHYGDHPYAHRVWSLAKKKKPKNQPDPPFPKMQVSVMTGLGNPNSKAKALKSEIIISGSDGRDPLIVALMQEETDSEPDQFYESSDETEIHTRSARSAYNNGDLRSAIKYATALSDHWVLGLSYWRLKDYQGALDAFRMIALDQSQDAWGRSGSAYWAGRSALALNQKEYAQLWFEMAAQYPLTFYGLLAEEKLGREPHVKSGKPPKTIDISKLMDNYSLNEDSPEINYIDNLSVRRFNALVSLNRRDDAIAELRHGMKRSTSLSQKLAWQKLGVKHNLNISPIKSNDIYFAPETFMLPAYKPSDGVRVPTSLLFAIARKESLLNPKARSYAGAYGFMQVMPSTANTVLKTDRFTREPTALFEPQLNMSIGQLYLEKLMNLGAVRGDLFRTLAAYNAGPRPVLEAVRSLGNDTDALLMMESIPVAQTRVYVEHVVANYWIYRHSQGLDSPSLSAAANDANLVLISADKG